MQVKLTILRKSYSASLSLSLTMKYILYEGGELVFTSAFLPKEISNVLGVLSS